MNTIGNKHTEVTMKATDLRIGNLVTDEFYDSFNTILKVESINEFGINLIIEDDGNYPEIASRWIEPELTFDKLRGIPLTEEWLLKFGFEKQKNNWKRICICNDWTYLYWERLAGLEVSVNKHSIMLPHINSVHQLQNLYYALTNEELNYDPN